MDDAAWARIGRDLADALMKFARERGPDERKVVAALETELCAERRAELNAPPDEPPPTEPDPAPAPLPPTPPIGSSMEERHHV